MPRTLPVLACVLLAASAVSAQENATAGDDATIEETVVYARRARVITPLPGTELDQSRVSGNVQTATGQDILDSGAVSATQFLSEQLQSITVADNAGNPFQQDVVFRGFTASPLIATPQGLSVYLDGARVNEAFGEVVNWDLIPLNAIEAMTLLPGSNPLFGLNSLGGALSLTTRSGFSAPGLQASMLGGSWGRRQIQAAAGVNDGRFGAFVSVNRLREDGWRDASSSELNQLFARVDADGRLGHLTASALRVENSLFGNGQVPYEDFKARPAGTYTSPDGMENGLQQFWASGRANLADSIAVTGMAYFREVDQASINGDFWNDWSTAARGRVEACDPGGIDGEADGIAGDNTLADGANAGDGPGIPDCLPNGVLGEGLTYQKTRGYSLQLNWSTPRNELVLGGAFDIGKVRFSQSEQLGFIGAGRQVVLDPDRAFPFDKDDLENFEAFNDLLDFILTNVPPILQQPLIDELLRLNGGQLPTAPSDRVGDIFAATESPVLRNRVFGKNSTWAAYFYDSFSLLENLVLNFGARWSHTRVQNVVVADRPIPLYQYSQELIARRNEACGVENGDLNARFQCTGGEFTYDAFNPSLGISWLIGAGQNVYANVSRGSRTPSAIELACARDKQATDPDVFQGCTIPTSFTSDPFLEQVRSTTYEFGGRGRLGAHVAWNAALYRTDLENDILFVSLGLANRGVFDTFGRTRRQGFELGLKDGSGRLRWNVNYGFVEATFESPATVINLSNSTSRKVQGELNELQIAPGDYIPGVPKHSLRAGIEVDLLPRFRVGLEAVGQSALFTRGNENNDHVPGGTDSDGTPNSRQRRYVGEGRIAGFMIFNLDARFDVTDHAQVFIQVDNLLDKQFVTAGQLGLNSFTTSRFGARDAAGFNYNSNDWTHSNFVGPGAPRAGWLGLSISY
ncbi:MAG: TonB-dependent receptor [Gammaproteobacteria bacterium]